MIDAPELARSLRVRGVALAAAEGALRFFPADALSDVERTDLAVHRDALLAVLAHEQARRERTMRSQVPEEGPIPFLMVIDGPHPRGRCASCGEALTPSERYRCGACMRAAIAVLADADSARATDDPDPPTSTIASTPPPAVPDYVLRDQEPARTPSPTSGDRP